ncbi:MAG: PHP domain-containing protein [Clostridia bacterium]|nr:PHP domain-containing protein [Clostridia bacterium]
MKYYYETHLHTCEGSACGVAHGADYIEFMTGLGYSGIVVTDHFFTGNCRPDRSLEWKDWVEQYCSGYEAALKAAEGTDFKVFFGLEYNFEGDEYLIYGVDKKWLLNNPDIMKQNRTEVYRRVKEYGGIMIQAHPYRERDYLSKIHLTPSACDGVEIYNAWNDPYMNALATDYAKKFGLNILTAGSDIHNVEDHYMGAVAFDHKIETVKDFVESLKRIEGTPVTLRNGKWRPVSDYDDEIYVSDEPYMPVIFHDK